MVIIILTKLAIASVVPSLNEIFSGKLTTDVNILVLLVLFVLNIKQFLTCLKKDCYTHVHYNKI